MDIELLKRELIRDEGIRLRPYHCPAGKLSIGVGRNLGDRGITESEAMMLFDNDIALVIAGLDRVLPWWRTLPDASQRGLANMAFNMGIPRLLGFKRMLAALRASDGDEASREALNSQWAEQIGARAQRVAGLLRKGTTL